MRLLKKTLPLLFLTLAMLQLPVPALAAGPGEAQEQPLAPPIDQVIKPRTGDLDEMIKRRYIRVLVSYNKTNFFLDSAATRGATYELFTQFEKNLNKKLKTRHLKIHLIFVPVPRNELLPRLKKGLGDIAAASLTVTSQRKKEVAFADPLYTQAKELVVTGPGAPALQKLEDLAGQTVYVRESSSYYQSLQKLNRKLKAAGKKQVNIQKVNELLETEDILEMTNAGLYQITVADDYLSNLWKRIFTDLTIHENLALRTHGQIAWAIRKSNPKLKKELDAFVKKVRVGSYLGNVINKRYFENTRFVRNSLSPDDVKRFTRTIEFFKKYSDQYGFDYLMITALAYQESRLDHSARSPAGAVGIMQILPSTAAGPPVYISDIQKLEKNIHAGVKYLRWLYDENFKDTAMNELDKVLFSFASYNAGPARISGLRSSAKKMGLDPDKWFRNVEVAAAKYIGRETVQYVSNIFKYYVAYRQISAKLAEKEKAIDQIKGN
ncbi:hypothetical protein AAU61_13080 [Desulfocarbo indianensis]|nr:hypothetical protein AAU61_13080 [Desulfocarbo indianensis]